MKLEFVRSEVILDSWVEKGWNWIDHNSTTYVVRYSDVRRDFEAILHEIEKQNETKD